MKRRHRMPFGAEYLGDGETRFRLWAPGAGALELVLGPEAAGPGVRMTPQPAGWFETVAAAAPGAAYRYRLESGLCVPDPASRSNPEDVHSASVVVDPLAYDWRDDGWRGRPWHEAVIYELHVGSYTPEGTFAALAARLAALADLGVTAIELMPVADFPGTRNWGYDGVLPFAPDAAYGSPDDLKRLVDAAHAHGLMVFLDVVYNHFGPDGNYLALYAPAFFTERHHTPWGAAINYDGAGAATVREFFIHNALYWLEEFHADGLRLDAVHAILDESPRHVLRELAERVRGSLGGSRRVHLMIENDANEASFLERAADGSPRWYDAQWNDDWHHCMHVLLTGEADGYYRDYAQAPTRLLGRSFAEGYAYQGEASAHRGGAARGEPSAGLPPTAFVSFLQNHDQIGNRALGERLTRLAEPQALRAAVCAWLLAPQIPLLFMGEESGAEVPFLFFCDFGPELAVAVREGRRDEFSGFAAFATKRAQEAIPDPGALETFDNSKLPWHKLAAATHAAWHELYRRLLALRRDRIVPLLERAGGHAGEYAVHGEGALAARWRLAGGARLELRLNLSAQAVHGLPPPGGELLHCEPAGTRARWARGELPPHAAACHLAASGAQP